MNDQDQADFILALLLLLQRKGGPTNPDFFTLKHWHGNAAPTADAPPELSLFHKRNPKMYGIVHSSLNKISPKFTPGAFGPMIDDLQRSHLGFAQVTQRLAANNGEFGGFLLEGWVPGAPDCPKGAAMKILVGSKVG